MTYKHLSQAKRYQIHALMKAGHDQSQIAKLLDRHKSTISRELTRNTGSRGYRPNAAMRISTVCLANTLQRKEPCQRSATRKLE
jgi:IS30 family transposase